ncbi:TlpA disulfide reductase family protein [Acidipila sp. EB88]|uniref:TlpA disulfide reductase family protein n=1 Tax=Acidipila sp. EB88 TaxID=2305226 RepID=UPI000F5E1961|nr:TlpA disulfide reductase family protein [Acidipila sp. EB88]RRA50114.1 TlpA family protein disulfide reductase [Acidipila sp. EB88]
MARKTLVILMVLVALGLIVWAGVSNFHTGQAQKAGTNGLQGHGPEMVLTPAGPGDAAGTATVPPDSADAALPPSPLLGKPAPNFELMDLGGKKVSLASYKGRPVLINFWATWCGPCKYEIPWLAALHTQYAPQGFEILGVSSDSLDQEEQSKAGEEKAEIAKAADRLHINYPVLIGGDTITQRYGGIDLLPQSFYVDRNGKIVAVITGAGSKQEAEADIKKAIASGA